MSADGGGEIIWSNPHVTVTDGEVEIVRTSPNLAWTLRHHVTDAVWTLRGVLVADEPATVGEAHLRVSPRDGSAWVWAAKGTALVVLADEAERPVVFRLRRGRLTPSPFADVDQFRWLETGADVRRFALVELSAVRCESWAGAFAMLPAWLPNLALPYGDQLLLSLPDDAVTGPDVDTNDDGYVQVETWGPTTVDVVGVSGDLRLDVDFAPPMSELLGMSAREIVSGAWPGRAERMPTDELAARVIVLLADGRADTDAYDVFTAELAERPDHSSLRTVALTRAAVAIPERALLDALDDALRALAGPESRTVVMAVLRAALWSPEVTDLVRRATPRQPDPAESVETLAARLGGGLPGRSGSADVVALARSAACLSAADAALDPDHWPMSAATIVEHTSRRLRSAAPWRPEVLAWLSIAQAVGEHGS